VVRARTLYAILGLVAAAALPAAAGAQSDAAPSPAAPAGWGHALAGDLMSPFCPGRALSDCPSPDAATLRAWILVQEASGRSREDVEAELLERYGEQLLSAPRARGFGLTAYAIPIGVFVLGGGLVWLFLRRQTREARAEPRARTVSLSPELERLVDEELGR
jgi:cytochrome c-type biogenesis protein CcmH